MLSVAYVELYKESRKQHITQDSISKTLVYTLYGDFFNEESGPAPTRSFGGITEWTDDDEVHRAVYDTFPLYREFQLTPYQTVILIISEIQIENTSHNCWKVTLTYDLPTQENTAANSETLNDNFRLWGLGPDIDENAGAGWSEELTQLSFNSSVKEVHKTTSIKLEDAVKKTTLPAAIAVPANMVVGKPAPVGQTEEELTGYDGYERQFTFQITKYMSPSQLKYAFVRRIHSMAGTVNNAIFFGFPALSVMFKGSQGSGDLIQNVPVTFEFEVRPNFKFSNAEEKLVSPDESDPTKMFDVLLDPDFTSTPLGVVHSGWSYVDYRYIPIPDADAKVKIMTPAFRYIHKTAHVSDFAKLRI